MDEMKEMNELKCAGVAVVYNEDFERLCRDSATLEMVKTYVSNVKYIDSDTIRMMLGIKLKEESEE